jgi:hypothetical protein
VRARLLLVVPVVLALAGCGGARRGAAPASAESLVRSPDAKVEMDENAANLASAVVTYNFGQLPEYIDRAKYRLLPHDLDQAVEPGGTTRRTFRLTVPHTWLVLDTVVTSALTESEAREDASHWRVSVRVDGGRVSNPGRYWVFYRNNGAQICRIYFPGDLGALNMGVHSLVLRPLSAGRHSLHVVADRTLGDGKTGRIVADYALRVLARPPTAREVAIAPDDRLGDELNVNRTPLTFRSPTK